MYKKIEFIIDGEPFGKKRPRANIICGHAHVHNDPENELYELKVANAYLRTLGLTETPNKPFFDDTDYISAIIVAHYPITKSMSKKKAKLALENFIQPTKKPDADNIAKSVLDALNGIAYKDDSQVTFLSVQKAYSLVPNVKVTLFIEESGAKE